MQSIALQKRFARGLVATSAICLALAVLIWQWCNLHRMWAGLQPAQGTVIGGAGVLIAGSLAFYGAHRSLAQAKVEAAADLANVQDSLREQQDALGQTHRRETIRDLRARFAVAASQLADPSATVRLAGVYAMASLADDWHSADPPNDSERQVCVDVLCANLRLPYSPETPIAQAAERQVRLTVTRVIREHLQKNAQSSWQDCNFDFSETTFVDAEMDFLSARFSGSVDFSGTTFASGTVSLRGAVFTGATVNFARATFDDATVTFWHATFEESRINFSGVLLAGGSLDFRETVFSSGDIDFFGSVFSGGEVDFTEAEFSGSEVNFTSPRAWSPGPNVPWTDISPAGITPSRWPPTLVPGTLRKRSK